MYGLTLEQVRVIRSVRACMICASTVSGFESGIFAVDHCHDSGVVRGILCQRCNFLLGNARDDVDVLLSAIKYLVKDHMAEPWNQGKSRPEEVAERRERRFAARLERTENSLAAAELRVKELEAVLAEVAEDTASAARRRAKDADAVERFISELISTAPPGSSRISVSALRTVWADWAGGAPCPVQSLHESLHRLGGILRRSSTGRHWEGIALRSIPRGSPEG
ncbi:endonuclease domain-containing protein [Streptomyces avermitilis]|uniref:endonuclease domain-containing protein n=1 Tax=Streptomyces avermitilis TaxID=33903 RepID=UPI00340B8DAE